MVKRSEAEYLPILPTDVDDYQRKQFTEGRYERTLCASGRAFGRKFAARFG